MDLMSRIEPTLGDLEDEYRLAYLKDDIRLSSIGIALCILFTISFAYNDYLFFGSTGQFWVLAFCRVALVSYGIVLLFVFTKLKSVAIYERLAFSFLIAATLFLSYIDTTRPSPYQMTFTLDVLIVFAFYLLFPNNLLFRTLSAFLLSLCTLLTAIFYRTFSVSPAMVTMILSLILANAAGIIISARWNGLKRGWFRASTQSKLAEEALQESEERYRLLADNSLTGIYVHQDGKFLYINRHAAETLGYSENELIGKSMWETVAPEDLEMTKAIVAARLQGGQGPSHYQFRALTRNGEVRWIEVRTTEIEHNGRPATLANALDITNRRGAEEALRQSEARYKELFENSSDIIYTHDLQGRYTSVNEAARRFLGYSSEEFLALTFRDLVDPDHIAVAEENFRIKVENGVDKTDPYEVKLRTKDGTSIWFEITSRLIRDQDKPVGVHGTARDITDRKKAEEALRESEEKYRLVVENANEAIVVAQDGKPKFVNPKTLELTGRSEHELLSRPFTDLIHPNDRAMVADRHERRIKGEHAPSVYAFRTADQFGNIRWMEINTVSITWEGRAATLNFLVDITAKRKMEEEIIKVQKLESLGVLAGGIAHDFNNILTAILGNISLARMQCQSPEKVKERMIEAEKACSQAQGLTQQLLTFSKGGAPIKRTAHISQLIEDCCRFAVRGSNVRCDISIHEDLFTVDVDQGQIGQVINNLIINSVHALPQGGVIHVYAENVLIDARRDLPLKGGNYVKIVVHDAGVGIPKNILPKIFDPYFTTKHNGTGLGLATSYSITHNHDGLITAESELGIGTTFCVYLPASQKELQIALDIQETAATGSGRILLMDDEDSIREVAREILSSLGYQVELAKDGAEAVSLYRSAKESLYPFDAVVLDLTVPGGMGGAEALERLLEIDPEIKAVVSSGYSNDPIMADYAKYGFRGVVAKPYAPRELGAALRAVISGNR